MLTVLKRNSGEVFDAGLINGPRGQGTLVTIGPDALTLAFIWGDSSPPLESVILIIGLPRPQTARDILRDATTLGVAAIHFVSTEKSENNYAQSSLWTTGEWQRHLVAGASQAFSTRIPEVSRGRTLADVLTEQPTATVRLALDNYEAPTPLASVRLAADSQVILALGPERGWSTADRVLLRKHSFDLVHLGPRVMRCETAVIAALTLVQSARTRV